MKRWLAIPAALGALLTAIPGCSFLFRTPVRMVSAEEGGQAAVPAAVVDASAFSFTANDGTPWPLAAQNGKVLLIVNSASRCGLTGQYEGLQALHERFQERGLVVVAVPSNDFRGQEPGTDAQILEFCTLNYGVTFPLMARSPVLGEDAHPFFRWLQTESAIPGPVTWNFSKTLVGRDGRLIARFEPRVNPLDERVVTAIESALAVTPSTP